MRKTKYLINSVQNDTPLLSELFRHFKNIPLFLLSVKTFLMCGFLYIWDVYTDLNFALTLLQNGSNGKSDLSLSTSHLKASKWRIYMKNKKKRKRKEL